MNPFAGAGDTGSTCMRQVANSATVIYPLCAWFCRYSWVTSDAGQLKPTKRRKRKGVILCKLNHYLFVF
jgi:hypothetical protein